MFEKVNPFHPDKVADRIAGAIVDMAYAASDNPHIAVEVLAGHGYCFVTIETDTELDKDKIRDNVWRIGGRDLEIRLLVVPQDAHLNDNQKDGVRCGDNGIFRGEPVRDEQAVLTRIASVLTDAYGCDGKYILDMHHDIADCEYDHYLAVCQSREENADEIRQLLPEDYRQYAVINPLGPWTGGLDVDTGLTNRKLGSDMGEAVTGGGLHGKDLSKADVSVNIYCHLLAEEYGTTVTARCAIGDKDIDFRIQCDNYARIKRVPYQDVVDKAMDYVQSLGGFEQLAEWGLIRP